MKNTQKGFAGIIVVIVVAVGFLGFGAYKVINKNEAKEESLDISAGDDNKLEDSVDSLSQTEGGDCDIKVGSIPPDSQVSFPLEIKGVIHNSKKDCAWKMFEGQVGTAQLYFNYNNQGWKSVGESVPIRIENNLPKLHEFFLDLNFSNSGIGLPSGTPMKIVFTAENPSGIGSSPSYEFPIIFKNKVSASADISDWKTYKNEEYGFEIKYPQVWVFATNKYTGAVTFYPKANASEINVDTITPHSSDTYVSIYPRGIGIEGVSGTTIQSQTQFAEPIIYAKDYVLPNGDVYATMVGFKNKPSSWESFGFLWARVSLKDYKQTCFLDGKEIALKICLASDRADHTGRERLVVYGTVDENERKIEKEMMKTFKFTK